MSTKTLKQHLLPRTAAVWNKIQDEPETADKLIELFYKIQKNTKHIAFTGHFSAGKSTMINTLLGEEVLPTSPIPTSANVVLLQKGEKSVILHDTKGNLIKLKGSYSIQQVKDYCRQGSEVLKIEIKDEYSSLQENVVIMDTPGIDSTDAAHRMATESALHLADLVFYVTDYNHVQSEENVTFVNEMIHKGKQIYLIVNQVDKHREEEVVFSAFRAQIEMTFEAAGLPSDHVFYTSLTALDHEHNQLSSVKNLVSQMITKEGLVQENAQNTLISLTSDYLGQKEEDLELMEISADELLSQISSVQKELDASQAALKNLSDSISSVSADLRDQLDYILKNANLIPFETRSKAERFIEASLPGFKVGLFFSKAKTAEEQKKRETELFEDISGHLQSQIVWHVNELLKKKAAEHEISSPDFLQKLQDFSIKTDAALLHSSVQKGATANAQYTLTYSNDLSESVKKDAKKQVLPLIEQMEQHVKNQNDAELQALFSDVSKRTEKLEGLNELYRRLIGFEQLKNDVMELAAQEKLPDLDLAEWIREHPEKTASEGTLEQKQSVSRKIEKESAEKTHVQDQTADQAYFADQIAAASNVLTGIPGFKQLSASLKTKAESLQNKSFTVALFGAFSAGKSSFANALLCEKLLPSSPTPTTAAINKIKPPAKDKPHGMIEVTFKTERAFLEEIADIFSIEAVSAEDARKKLAVMKGDSERLKSLLPLYQKALSVIGSISGKTIAANREEYKEYVSNEEKACTVEEVVIYFDSPLTQSGITIVDTPGADSFNSRHTEVAFDYIKNADAILFVTYYNHPFSKGDREFLKQLGRVKDTFSMDKMFFIINAIDLAGSKEEIDLVKDYIRDQLLTHEIRHPRLYGISSMQELAKTADPLQSEFGVMKEEFHHFMNHDLSASMIQSAKLELSIAKQQLQSVLDAADSDQEKRELEIKTLTAQREKVLSMLNAKTQNLREKQLEQEVKEQLFYVKQRTILRFPDLFKEAFHPGAFGGSKSPKEVLEECYQDLLASLQFYVLQELQAVTLRLEKYVHSLLSDAFKQTAREMLMHNGQLRTSMPDLQKIETPKIRTSLKEHVTNEEKQPLKKFKNTKAFFEKNEKKQISEELQEKLALPISIQLTESEKQFKAYYGEKLREASKELTGNLVIQTDSFYEALLSAYTLEDVSAYERSNEMLEKILSAAGVKS
ncbi:dynamin family protein [Metabacillus indicus]|uniref:dynamin family protein n=1 Tax=Metabacillus indicus TaxID=246786 RepID=UPI003CE68ADB